jgi:xanthine dehydrogenase FAD-binding subunit
MYSSGFIDMYEINKYYGVLIKPIDDQRSTAEYRKSVCLRLLADFIKNIL